jgi:hypothetical protein
MLGESRSPGQSVTRPFSVLYYFSSKFEFRSRHGTFSRGVHLFSPFILPPRTMGAAVDSRHGDKERFPPPTQSLHRPFFFTPPSFCLRPTNMAEMSYHSLEWTASNAFSDRDPFGFVDTPRDVGQLTRGRVGVDRPRRATDVKRRFQVYTSFCKGRPRRTGTSDFCQDPPAARSSAVGR